MEFLHKLIDLLRDLGNDKPWRAMVDFVGLHNLYIVLFLIVFCETGLVIWPFLPGDSLIFAVGAIGGREIGIDLWIVGPLLVLAALSGDNVNYWLGRKLGPAVFNRQDSKLLSKKHLTQAHSFYEKYGAKTIILARFVPIVRTFAPFVAGVGKMNYGRFLIFSIVGAIAWVSICLAGGYYLGSRPLFKKHFELVVLAIIVVSLIPMAVEVMRARRAAKRGFDPRVATTAIGEGAGKRA
jgi:membrane-associated protein